MNFVEAAQDIFEVVNAKRGGPDDKAIIGQKGKAARIPLRALNPPEKFNQYSSIALVCPSLKIAKITWQRPLRFESQPGPGQYRSPWGGYPPAPRQEKLPNLPPKSAKDQAVQWLAKSASAQTQCFKKSARFLILAVTNSELSQAHTGV